MAEKPEMSPKLENFGAVPATSFQGPLDQHFPSLQAGNSPLLGKRCRRGESGAAHNDPIVIPCQSTCSSPCFPGCLFDPKRIDPSLSPSLPPEKKSNRLPCAERTLLLDILPLTGRRPLSHRLGKNGHEFLPRVSIPILNSKQASSADREGAELKGIAYGIVGPGKARVGAQFLLGNQLL